MKAHLLFEERDLRFEIAFSPIKGFAVTGPELPPRAGELAQDLGLADLLRAMAGGDALLFDVAKLVVFESLTDPREITYRQEVLSDCLAHPEVAREIYSIAVQAIVGEREIHQPFGKYPTGVMRRAVEVLGLFVGLLRRLRRIADDHVAAQGSRAFRTLFTMLREELDDEYFRRIDEHLARLKLKDGILLSAKLGKGNRGVGYVLRTPKARRRNWRERVGIGPRSSYSFEIAPRDEAGGRMLSELNDRGVNLIADALAQSTDHILSFFTLLCGEIGFYVGCVNLHEQLRARGALTCMPVPLPSGDTALSFQGIYDVCLALRSEAEVVGNDANADEKPLVMITGANSGGKSTLLRGIGLAQLMMQCGMFVGADTFCANVGEAIFTHFIREEDETMTSGKLDEELGRMSEIADLAVPRSIIMFNESFAATNEREGSEIAHQVVEALLDAGIKVIFVTHQFTLADTFYSNGVEALFLRAERTEDGRRTFKFVEGAPLPTSFGEDLYRRIGGLGATAAPG